MRGFYLIFPMSMQKGSKKLEYLFFLLVDNTESCHLWTIHDWVEEPYKLFFQNLSDWYVLRGDRKGESAEKSDQAGYKTTFLHFETMVYFIVKIIVINSLPDVLTDQSDYPHWFGLDKFSWVLNEFVEGFDQHIRVILLQVVNKIVEKFVKVILTKVVLSYFFSQKAKAD